MNHSEFNSRITMLREYYQNTYKWKIDEAGDYKYYKGKRNLKELEFMVNLILGDEIELINSKYVKNYEGKISGGEVIGKCYVDAEFNGMKQGTEGADIYVVFCLYETGYYSDQSDSLDRLLNRL